MDGGPVLGLAGTQTSHLSVSEGRVPWRGPSSAVSPAPPPITIHIPDRQEGRFWGKETTIVLPSFF